MTTFNDVFIWLQTSGAYDTLLPFFLIFTVIFAFLQKVPIFGKDNKGERRKFNIIVSLIISLLVIIPHVTNTYAPGRNPVLIIQNAIPDFAVWIIAILMVWIILSSLGFTLLGEPNNTLNMIVGFFAITLVAVIFSSAAGWLPPDVISALRLSDPGLQSVLLIGAIILLVFWFILGPTEEDGGKKGGNGKSPWENFSDTFGKTVTKVK